MRTYITEDYQAMSRRAAHIIAAQVHLNPACVLGLATGSTPIGMYKQLIEWYKAGDLDFSQVKSVNLDEYAGLAPTHDQSYRYFMQTNLFDHINIDPANTNVPSGLAADPAAECRRYNQVIRDLGGIDVQVLGMGHNGHIGFNEPADIFVTPTHVVDLTERTIDANARFFATRDDVPRQAFTMGIGPIMAAKKILLIASGEEKAEAVYNTICGAVDPHCQGSILQLHPDVVMVADEAALSKVIAAGVKV